MRTRSRRWIAGAVAAVALLAAGCFPDPPPGSESPHHDDPFLTCVRQRESGGNYAAHSPDFQFHGAYQFHQNTWNATATHVGRGDLVGVDPHTGSPALQDDMAWALYQWQGTAPWAGSGC